jgi:hypothetical protein
MRPYNGTSGNLRELLNRATCALCGNPIALREKGGEDGVPEFQAECCELEYTVVPELARVHVIGG